MRSKQILALGVGALGLLAASCGSSGDDSESATTEAASVTTAAADTTAASAGESGEAVKVAFITKFPVAFFTAMEDAAKAYAEENPGRRHHLLLLQDPGRRRLPDRADRGRGRPGLPGDRHHADGPRGHPGPGRRSGQGRQGRPGRQRPRRVHEEDRRRRDRQRQGRPGRRRVPEVAAQVRATRSG